MVNEVPINSNKLTTDNFAIRWYVFKDHRDFWHIDGILVPKSGILKIQKTFPKKAVADGVKETFKIEVTGDFFAGTDENPNTTITKKLNDKDVKIETSENTGSVTYTWQLAVFGSEYQIKESGYTPSEMSSWKYENTDWTYTPVTGEKMTGTGTGEENQITVTTQRSANDQAERKQAIQTFAFTNHYNQVVDLDLKKVSTGGNGTSEIDGAVFKLSKKNDNGSYIPVQDKQEIKVTKETTELTNMQDGVYKLEEVKAPEAHMLLNIPIYFKVESGEIQLCKEDGSVDTQVKNMYTLSKADSNNSNLKNTYVLTIKNEILYELPSTGGSGIFWYVIGGTLLMLAAVLLLYRKNRYKRLVK